MLLGHGIATLVAGTVTVSVRRLPARATVLLTRVQALGTLGDLRRGALTTSAADGSGGSFVIQSLNVLDLSTVHWAVVL